MYAYASERHNSIASSTLTNATVYHDCRPFHTIDDFFFLLWLLHSYRTSILILLSIQTTLALYRIYFFCLCICCVPLQFIHLSRSLSHIRCVANSHKPLHMRFSLIPLSLSRYKHIFKQLNSSYQ